MRKRWILFGAIALVAVGGTATALATGSGGDSLVARACVNASSGAMKIVQAGQACKKKETALEWPAGTTTISVSAHTGSGEFGSPCGGERLTSAETAVNVPADGWIEAVGSFSY